MVHDIYNYHIHNIAMSEDAPFKLVLIETKPNEIDR